MKTDNYELPIEGLVRLPDILRCIPISKSAWWEGCKKGKYPKSIKLGKRTTCWFAQDIRKLINELKHSGSQDASE